MGFRRFAFSWKYIDDVEGLMFWDGFVKKYSLTRSIFIESVRIVEYNICVHC